MNRSALPDRILTRIQGALIHLIIVSRIFDCHFEVQRNVKRIYASVEECLELLFVISREFPNTSLALKKGENKKFQKILHGKGNRISDQPGFKVEKSKSLIAP